MYRKKRFYLLPILLLSYVITTSCSDDDNTGDSTRNPEEATIQPVKNLTATPSREEYAIDITWRNPADPELEKVEITCQLTGTTSTSTSNAQQISVTPDKKSSITIQVATYGRYTITATAIGKDKTKSAPVTVESESSKGVEKDIPLFFLIADTLMTSMIEKCMGGPRDVWRDYPNPTGPYWDGDALVWGQGGGFSAFAAMREASLHFTGKYADKYAGLENRMITSIDRFRVVDSRNNVEGYSVYPASGNDRYFDDNVWIGIDMVDLYRLTQKSTTLTRANIVWRYLLTGMDRDGGVFWKELPDKSTSKHACSTAPTAVLAAKMYLATNQITYLEHAKKSYQFCIDILQDKADYLICDLQREDGSIDQAKYTYNSGQTILAGVLLYNITGEARYIQEAQQIAEAVYSKWFYTSYSTILGKNISMVSGHTWFNAVTLRGFIELYKVDGNRKYVTAYEDMLTHAWYSNCRNKELNFLNYDNFSGGANQTNWEILHLGATVEMVARLANLQAEE